MKNYQFLRDYAQVDKKGRIYYPFYAITKEKAGKRRFIAEFVVYTYPKEIGEEKGWRELEKELKSGKIKIPEGKTYEVIAVAPVIRIKKGFAKRFGIKWLKNNR